MGFHNLIRLGTTRKPFEHSVEPKEDIGDDEEFMETISRIRSQDYHIIFQEMNRILATEDEAAWVYFLGPTILITPQEGIQGISINLINFIIK